MNLWNRFQALGLSPSGKRTVGECVDSVDDETTVEYPGGGRVVVRGAGVIGTRYFVRNGQLDGEAPALVALEIEV